MKKKINYEGFVRCCHDYLNNKERLIMMRGNTQNRTNEIGRFKNDELDFIFQKILEDKVEYVENTFKKLKEKDPVLSKIMYLNLVEKKTFDEIGKRRLVEVSRRTASRKYAKKLWEDFYNENIFR